MQRRRSQEEGGVRLLKSCAEESQLTPGLTSVDISLYTKRFLYQSYCSSGLASSGVDSGRCAPREGIFEEVITCVMKRDLKSVTGAQGPGYCLSFVFLSLHLFSN